MECNVSGYEITSNYSPIPGQKFVYIKSDINLGPAINFFYNPCCDFLDVNDENHKLYVSKKKLLSYVFFTTL